ncbi:hypothetical protein [Microbulbifer sp. ANSA001]|uniref:hypothetical protein n=1 Tax=Microbulbifer sp. ANSA001 TaxID=3243358 RepID=UPI0040419944
MAFILVAAARHIACSPTHGGCVEHEGILINGGTLAAIDSTGIGLYQLQPALLVGIIRLIKADGTTAIELDGKTNITS